MTVAKPLYCATHPSDLVIQPLAYHERWPSAGDPLFLGLTGAGMLAWLWPAITIPP
jgi:hypothetical protein